MKITLKTLAQATKQQVFDQVVEHLLTQNEVSKDDVATCLYRSSEGLKCAAGCLIADDEYNVDMEGASWRGAIDAGFVKTEAHYELIDELQRIHDDWDVAYWPERLLNAAEDFSVSPERVHQLSSRLTHA